jgi:hypothetical protein
MNFNKKKYNKKLKQKTDKNYKIRTKNYFKKNVVEELMINRFHPRNIEKFYDWGFDVDLE